MKCKVVLCGEKKEQNFACAGELNLGKNSFTLSYLFDKSHCLLTYDGQILRHEKRGEIPVCIEFTENKNTLCKIGEGEFSGSVPVFTKSLIVHMGAQTVSISVFYELDGEVKKMQILAEL